MNDKYVKACIDLAVMTNINTRHYREWDELTSKYGLVKTNARQSYQSLRRSLGESSYFEMCGDGKYTWLGKTYDGIENNIYPIEVIESELCIDIKCEDAIDRIKNFSSLSKGKWKHESQYHNELYSYLNGCYNNKGVFNEPQRGSSRPDIGLGNNIAIEIKGPTAVRDLDTISSKSLKYRLYWEHLIIVLFDIRCSNRYFEEWRDGIERDFPNVNIIVGKLDNGRTIQQKIY